MFYNISNLVFEGGGVLGISYLGVLDFLYNNSIMKNLKRVAGTSAGAITACLTSFNLPLTELKQLSDTLDYSKIPEKDEHRDLKIIPNVFKKEFQKIFDVDINSIYRLIKDYGWYSSEYFYEWLKEQIASQFDNLKKSPPYTFEDFRNSYLHKDERPFLDLYVIGTDISTKSSKVFSYETTPNMEVAKAVRISMSIPLFFESIKISENELPSSDDTHIFSDGGVMRNYPINLFDSYHFKDKFVNGINIQTLGAKFKNNSSYYTKVDNIIDYIENLIRSYMTIQQDVYNHSPEDKLRSIEIDTKDISYVDFDIKSNDEKYNLLYKQGYEATKNYFQSRMLL